MTRLVAIARNTFLQSVRQPVYFFVIMATLLSLVAEVAMTAWTLDDDDKLLRDLALSTLLLQGLFLSALAASTVISGEIEDKTVLTVAAKPVGRLTFIVGKFFGVFGALLLAHYVATLGLFMALRHGVLQTSAQSSDPSVLIAGPGIVVLALLGAGVINYLYDRSFFDSVILLIVGGLTLSSAALLVIDRNGHIRSYECTQDVPGLPKGLDPKDFHGIVTYRDETPPGSAEQTGKLVRREWLGPISEPDRIYLDGLTKDEHFKNCIGYLVDSTRKLLTPQVLKAAILLIGVLMILAGFAVAVSTRLSTTWTIVLTLVLVAGGLVSDYYQGVLSRSYAVTHGLPSQMGLWALHVLPNFQCFWLMDAITFDAVIPWKYLLNCFAYAGVYTAGLIALGAALFETREVG